MIIEYVGGKNKVQGGLKIKAFFGDDLKKIFPNQSHNIPSVNERKFPVSH